MQVARKGNGATTVSATMFFASKVYSENVKQVCYVLILDLFLCYMIFAQVGIQVFVTGGIGGVHRDGENS